MRNKPKQPGAAEPKKIKKKPGPQKFDPKDKKLLEKIENLAAGQMLEKDIAYCVGLNPTYFSELKALHPELSEAIKRGNSRGLELATQTILESIREKNMTGTIFYLKCKGGWRENGPTDDTPKDSDITKAAILAALLRTTG